MEAATACPVFESFGAAGSREIGSPIPLTLARSRNCVMASLAADAKAQQPSPDPPAATGEAKDPSADLAAALPPIADAPAVAPDVPASGDVPERKGDDDDDDAPPSLGGDGDASARTVYVRNLAEGGTLADVMTLFAELGVSIAYKKSKHVIAVEMSTVAAATDALEMNGVMVQPSQVGSVRFPPSPVHVSLDP